MQWHHEFTNSPQSLTELEKILKLYYQTDQDAAFFTPPHPFELHAQDLGFDTQQLSSAVQRILAAIQSGKKIVIFGDYDVDGISATAILTKILEKLDAKVATFIPDRFKHGYGLSSGAIEEIKHAYQPGLIITVDNGIVAHQEATQIKEAGIQLIITDHHQPSTNELGQPNLPQADEVVYSTKLCGATVAWMIGLELAKKSNLNTDFLADQLDLCALATIADQVPLKGANRSFAYHGLEALHTSQRPAILALCAIANVDQKQLQTHQLNFQLAPRLNAAGRLASGQLALDLLLADDIEEATQIVQKLDALNTQRQTITYQAIDQVLQQAAIWEDESLILVASSEYHDGVIGLIAGKLMEQYHKPAIVLRLGKDEAKGSVRSVKGINIIDFLRQFEDNFISLGGHPLAAGFSIDPAKLDQLKAQVLPAAKTQFTPDLLQPKLNLVAEISLDLVTPQAVQVIESFSPFGAGHRAPKFSWPQTKLLAVNQIGKTGNHLKLTLDTSSGSPVTALFWNGVQKLSQLPVVGQLVTVAGRIDTNTYRGSTSGQIVVTDLI